MPNPPAASPARRQAQQPNLTSGHSQKSADADLAKYSAQKAVFEAQLTNLRSKLSDLEADNWIYQAPRYSYQ